jgi:hypothetical protein
MLMAVTLLQIGVRTQASSFGELAKGNRLFNGGLLSRLGLTPALEEYEDASPFRGDHNHSNSRPGPVIDLPMIRSTKGNLPIQTEIVGKFVLMEGHVIVGMIDEAGAVQLDEEFRPQSEADVVFVDEHGQHHRHRDLGGVVWHYSTSGQRHRWEGGYVPLYIQPGMPEIVLGQIYSAMKELEANSPIRFRIIEDKEHPTRFKDGMESFSDQEQQYLTRLEEAIQNDAITEVPGFIDVQYNTDGLCVANVGRQIFKKEGGYVTLSHTGSCGHKSTMHEIMHGLGFKHEQSRTDRDQYVSVNMDAVKLEKRHNYNRYAATEGEDIYDYDYASVMHYSMTSFLDASTGYSNTMTVNNEKFETFKKKNHFGLNLDVSMIGASPQLSKLDMMTLDYVYGKCKSDIPYAAPIMLSNTTHRITSTEGTFVWNIEAKDGYWYKRSAGSPSAAFDGQLNWFTMADDGFARRSSKETFDQHLKVTLSEACLVAIVIRWLKAPTSDYTVHYNTMGKKFGKTFASRGGSVQERTDHVVIAGPDGQKCLNIQDFTIDVPNSEVTMLTEVELIDIETVGANGPEASDWVEYPWGPCVKPGQSKENVQLRQVHCRTPRGLCLPDSSCHSSKPATSKSCGDHVTVRHWYDFDPKPFGTNIASQKCYSINLPFDADASSHFQAAVDLGQFWELTNEKCARMCQGYDASATWKSAGYGARANDGVCSCYSLRNKEAGFDAIDGFTASSSCTTVPCFGDSNSRCGGSVYTELADHCKHLSNCYLQVTGSMVVSMLSNVHSTTIPACGFEDGDPCTQEYKIDTSNFNVQSVVQAKQENEESATVEMFDNATNCTTVARRDIHYKATPFNGDYNIDGYDENGMPILRMVGSEKTIMIKHGKWSLCSTPECSGMWGYAPASFSDVNILHGRIGFEYWQDNLPVAADTMGVQAFSTCLPVQSECHNYYIDSITDSRLSFLNGGYSLDGYAMGYPILRHEDGVWGMRFTSSTGQWKLCANYDCTSGFGNAPRSDNGKNILYEPINFLYWQDQNAVADNGVQPVCIDELEAKVRDVCVEFVLREADGSIDSWNGGTFVLNPVMPMYEGQFVWTNVKGRSMYWRNDAWLLHHDIGAPMYYRRIENSDTLSKINVASLPKPMSASADCLRNVVQFRLNESIVQSERLSSSNVLQAVSYGVEIAKLDSLIFSASPGCSVEFDAYFGKTTPVGVSILLNSTTRVNLRATRSQLIGKIVFNGQNTGWNRVGPWRLDVFDLYGEAELHFEVINRDLYNGAVAIDNINFASNCNAPSSTTTTVRPWSHHPSPAPWGVTTSNPWVTTAKPWTHPPSPAPLPCQSIAAAIASCKERRGDWAWTCTHPELKSVQDTCGGDKILNSGTLTCEARCGTV